VEKAKPGRNADVTRKLDALRGAIKEVWMRKDIEHLNRRSEDLKKSLSSAIIVNIQYVCSFLGHCHSQPSRSIFTAVLLEFLPAYFNYTFLN